jgi:hypothetical protein
MGLKIQSSTYPQPQTFNEWQAFLKEQRDKAYLAKLGRSNEDLIDIERD